MIDRVVLPNGVETFAPYTLDVLAYTRCSTRPPTRFEQVDEPDEVARDVRVRILQRITHARLRREMNDTSGRMVSEQALESPTIREIELRETEPLEGIELAQPRFFEPNVVVRVEVVQPDDSLAALEQTLCDMHPDEAGAAGDEDRHATAAQSLELSPRPYTSRL